MHDNVAIPEDVIVPAGDLPWVNLIDGVDFKMINWDQASGYYVLLLKLAAGTAIPRHKHITPSEYYVLKGRMEYRAGAVTADTWGLEPAGAVHDNTTWTQQSIVLYRSGPTLSLDENDNVLAVYDGAAYYAVWNAAGQTCPH